MLQWGPCAPRGQGAPRGCQRARRGLGGGLPLPAIAEREGVGRPPRKAEPAGKTKARVSGGYPAGGRQSAAAAVRGERGSGSPGSAGGSAVRGGGRRGRGEGRVPARTWTLMSRGPAARERCPRPAAGVRGLPGARETITQRAGDR